MGKQGLRRVSGLSEVTQCGTHTVTNETKGFRPPVCPHQTEMQEFGFLIIQKDINTDTSTVSSPLTDSSPVPFQIAAV